MTPAQLAPIDLGLGILLILMAILTFALRRAGRVDLLGWRESMQAAMGEKAGDVAHFALYTVSPALLGMSFLVLWWVRRGL
ncbi:MAG: hypothetical protein KDA24_13530 [Deltaproteobacteria bacterium]|nr:hypothetical protein [Deltaproteobacteria bacterium]